MRTSVPTSGAAASWRSPRSTGKAIIRSMRWRRVSIDSGQASILHQGHDFYASPTVSPSGGELLFIAWDHPNMPWDGTQLLRAGLEGAGIGGVTVVAGGASESVLQPTWLDDGTVLYLSDVTGFWNLHCLDSAGARVVLEEAADYAGPPWQFGNRDYAVLNERFVAARRHGRGEQDLVLIRPGIRLRQPPAGRGAPSTATSRPTAASSFSSEPMAMPQANSPAMTPGPGAAPRWCRGAPLDFDGKWLSRPSHIEFPTRDGGRAYAWLYLPADPAPILPGGKSPLLVTTPWRAYRSRIAQAAPAAAVLYEPRLGGRRHQLPGQHRLRGGATATP